MHQTPIFGEPFTVATRFYHQRYVHRVSGDFCRLEQVLKSVVEFEEGADQD